MLWLPVLFISAFCGANDRLVMFVLKGCDGTFGLSAKCFAAAVTSPHSRLQFPFKVKHQTSVEDKQSRYFLQCVGYPQSPAAAVKPDLSRVVFGARPVFLDLDSA